MNRSDLMMVKKDRFAWIERMLLGITIVVIPSLFWIGMHNADIGMNMMVIGAELNITFKDHATDGTYYSGEEGYITGLRYMQIAFLGAFTFMVVAALRKE